MVIWLVIDEYETDTVVVVICELVVFEIVVVVVSKVLVIGEFVEVVIVGKVLIIVVEIYVKDVWDVEITIAVEVCVITVGWHLILKSKHINNSIIIIILKPLEFTL